MNNGPVCSSRKLPPKMSSPPTYPHHLEIERVTSSEQSFTDCPQYLKVFKHSEGQSHVRCQHKSAVAHSFYFNNVLIKV